MSGALLFDDSPLIVSPELAALLKEISPNIDPCSGAIVLQQVHYSIQKESGKIAQNGLRFIFNTYRQWQERLSWLSIWQIRKVFYCLRDTGLLVFKQLDAQKWNQRGYYRIDYERLEALRLSKCGMPTHRDVDGSHIEVCDPHTSEQRDLQKDSTNTCKKNSSSEEIKESTRKEETIEIKPTSEELDAVERELRKLRINGQEVAMAVRKHWKNAAAALEATKQDCNEGWVKQPIARFLKHLTNPSCGDFSAAALPSQKKEYPQPTADQLSQLEKLGVITHTCLNEPGYPEVVAVDGKKGVLPWWVALGVEV